LAVRNHRNTQRFRFSFIRKHYGDQDEKFTPWRRYTYFVQPDKYNKTFKRRIEGSSFQSLEEIQEAFSVEPLSKDFYKELSKWYFYALTQVEFPNDRNEDPHTLRANAMIRLITRLIFVWFMKQNRLVSDDLFDKDQVDQLINYQDATGSTYYKAILQNLFFATLNTPPEKERKFVNRQYGVQGFYRYKRLINDEDRFLELMKDIPFLNGGLFENLDQVGTNSEEEIRVDCFSDRKVNEERLKVPDYLFFGSQQANLEDYLGTRHRDEEVTGLIDLLNRYDFTIDENTPYDQEVALDPELLGLVFENLLASYNPETESTARRESGSFYTPREVVDFMVEESLLEHLAQQTQLNRESLKALFKNNDEQPFEKQEDKAVIVNALSNVKLIDPACGSGAFPMGALQKMVHVLSLLDHDNQMWKERQKEIAIEETKEAYEIGDHEERRQRLEAIEQAFEEGVKEPDYARKLFLIENTMYGVDIQPIAIQIAKLRFFIALLVDQETEPDRENFGIMALPNLETKFVAADTLAPLPGATDQYGISWQFIEPLEKELNQVRHELFSARTTRTKEKKRQRHMEIQEEIGRVLQENGFPNTMAEAIKNWNAFDPNTRADWFDPEWMFGLNKFDIVIGNPPYIRIQSLPSATTKQYNQNYKAATKNYDIYVLFVEKGMELLRKGGSLIYIQPTKFFNADYGEGLRNLISKKQWLCKILDFKAAQMFNTATNYTCILHLKKAQQKEAQYISFQNNPSKEDFIRFINNGIHSSIEEITIKNDQLSKSNWNFHNPAKSAAFEKLEEAGTPLGKLTEKIFQGLVTSADPVYILRKTNQGYYSKYLEEHVELEDHFMKPLLKGGEIKRYKIDFQNLYIIFPYQIQDGKAELIPPKKLKANYPKVWEYLKRCEDKLRGREKGKMDHEGWYGYGRTQNIAEFGQPKIMTQVLASKASMVLDEQGEYRFVGGGNAGGYGIVLKQNAGISYHCLLGILNSSLIDDYLQSHSTIFRGGFYSYSRRYLKDLPIVPPSAEEQAKIEQLAKEILEKKESGQDTNEEEQQIDLMVYKLYDLTYDEVLVVDPEVPFGREMYEEFSFEELNV